MKLKKKHLTVLVLKGCTTMPLTVPNKDVEWLALATTEVEDATCAGWVFDETSLASEFSLEVDTSPELEEMLLVSEFMMENCVPEKQYWYLLEIIIS